MIESFDCETLYINEGANGLKVCRESDVRNVEKERGDLKVLLSDCLHDLCRLCRQINPQHQDCEQCDDTDYFREALK